MRRPEDLAGRRGYAVAVLFTLAAFLFREEVGRLVGEPISITLCGLAAIFGSIWIAGLGPSLFSAALTSVWFIANEGAQNPVFWIHDGLYIVEAAAFCFYGRQLRAARDEAAESAGWQRHLVETAGEGIWTVDPNGIIRNANPRIAEMLGCGVDQIVSHPVEEFLFPEDIPAERIRFQNRRPGVRDQYDRRLRRADGSELWTLACSSPYTSRDRDAGILTMMTDITERKQAEHALRRSERKFRELFENVREGVYQTSLDGRILAANPELLRMLGFTHEDELNVPGVVKGTFVDPELHLTLRDRLERDGSYANVEFQLRTRDNRIITVSENARVVRDENGDILYFEGTLTDITEKLRVEQQLRDAQKMEALGRLAGGIARDLHSVGDVMASGLRHAIEALPPESAALSALASVTRSLSSASALTHQILDFSQRQVGSRAASDLNACVREFEPRLRSVEGCEISFQCCDAPALTFADPGHVEQILLGLITHFVDGPVLITTYIEPSGPFACLSLCGNSPSGSTNAVATSQAILAQYGGFLIVVSEPNQLRYAIHLPLASAPRVAEPAASFGTAITVLLVEEEPLIRELSRDMLESQGFRVLEAANADEADRIARGPQAVDVLVSSRSTDEKGASLFHILRSLRPTLKVLFIAGYADGAPGSGALPAGAAMLQKPYSGEVLGRKIRELIAK